MREVIVLSDKDADNLVEKAVKAFYDELEGLLETEDAVVISLSGGEELKPFYDKIPQHADRLTREQWSRIHFFWTDERLVPPGDDQSNFKMADELFLRELGEMRFLLEENVHRFRGEAENVDEEIARYDDELNELGGDVHIPILGVGKDCHVASLFPNHELVDEEIKEFLHLDDSPKEPRARMTISPRHIKESAAPFIFFISDRKADAYECFNSGENPKECPCRLAKHGDGRAYVVTDLE